MPKVTITFNLPEEQSEYSIAHKAPAMASILWDFTQLVREKTKYGDGKPVSWEEVREQWWATLQEAGYDPYGGV